MFMTITGIMCLACLQATSMEIVNTMRDLLHLNPLYGEQFRTLLSLSKLLSFNHPYADVVYDYMKGLY